ncbi:GvpL/GvpF family gas vesicle protein [Methanoplanus endosymbiosus]|uniref:GvpL/GvpF family gas vesicle protein n=1 Tax=Methanoplanus endosymbiosus TaxID=33865 RepID=A0A9E7PMP1_9EURY|nr:GvpL/GvpF family gas vesicle protein [Methanoplanus endosymbiosus]UUX93053.1 GvpL/GvpF family gas vesicle protein [Methanoplanus endosymbiosus]
MRTTAKKRINTARYKYVFCIIANRKNYSFVMNDREKKEIYSIHYKDISAVVADAWSEKYEILDDGMVHEKVVETASKHFPVIPMGFGQASTEEDIKAFLMKNYAAIKKLFRNLKGKTELGVNVSLNEKKLIEDIYNENEKIRIFSAGIKDQNDKLNHNIKIKIGRIVSEEFDKKGNKIAEDFYRSLKNIADSDIKCRSINKLMVLNSAFLVENDKIPEFDRVLSDMENKYGDAVNIRYIISPPYNFSNLRVS